MDKPKELTKINLYTYRYDVNGVSIQVFEIKNFPNVLIKAFDEIDI